MSNTSANLASEVEADRRAIFRVEARKTPSEWAATNRYLSTKAGSAEPGLWRADRTPYVVEPMDAFIDRAIREIVLLWSTQVGKSTLIENLLGFIVDEDPGPSILVLPSEQIVKETLEERLKPLIEDSEAIRRHVRPEDITQTGIKFDTMRQHFGWAGSPASLARRSCRYLFEDELDKFPLNIGREADPSSLAGKRLATYKHRARRVKTSTPTTREGPICKAWDACPDKRYYFVPCPHCGAYQRLVWQQVKWMKLDVSDKVQRANTIVQGKLAWYECGSCKQRIENHHKPKMLRAGKWVSEGQTVSKDGTINGDRIRSEKVGYHLSAIYSPWVDFHDLAGMWIMATGDPILTQDFYNSILAEPYSNIVAKTRPSLIREKSERGGPAGIAPKDVSVLIATADTQDKTDKHPTGWFKVHIGAWSNGYRYRLVREAVCYSFDDLYQLAFSSYPIDGGGEITPRMLLIDSGGGRTSEVYEFALRDARIIPTKGASHSMRRPWTVTQLANGVSLTVVDSGFYKDMLNRLINDPDPDKWLPHKDVSEDFCIELTNEHKIVENGKLKWKEKTGGARVEALDCEALQNLAADILNMGVATPAPVEAAITTPERDKPTTKNWLTGYSRY